MFKRMIAGTAFAMVTASGAAFADEVWATEIGDVIYEADLDNGMAVLSYPLEDGEVRGLAYIAGLAGEYEGRTGYDGVWMEPAIPADEGCDVEIAAPATGEVSNSWGRVKLVFVDPDFPGSWVALRGECFGEPTEMLVGRPVTASSE